MAKNFGLLNAFRGIGYAAGSFFSAFFTIVPLFTFTGIEKPFVIAAIGAVLCLLLIFFFFEETYKVSQKIKTGFVSIISNLKTGLQMRQINLLLIIIFILCFGWSFYWEFIPVTWIEALNVTPAQVGTLYAYGIAFNAIASAILIRPLFDRFSNGKILLYSTLLLGLYIFVLLFKLSMPFLWIFIPLQQYLMALIYPASMAMISNSASKEVQGQTLGMFQSIKGLAYTVSPFSGVLIGISYKIPIMLSGSSMILAGLMIWLFFRKKIFQRNGL
jgi:MFS family permease